MNQLTQQQRSEIDAIASLVTEGVRCWHEAGQRLCGLIDADPSVVDRICDSSQYLSRNVLALLEKVGRKQLLPELLLRNGPGYSRLRLMPYEAQVIYAKKPVDVLILTSEGQDTLKISVENLTSRQARQVFSDEGGVRDIAAQRAFLADEQRLSLPGEFLKPYKVSGKHLVVTQPCKLTLQEIGVILAEMSP